MATSSSADELVFGLVNLPPYVLSQSNHGEIAGLYPDIVRELALRVGMKVKIQPLPLWRMLTELSDSHIDATILLQNAKLDLEAIPVHEVHALVNVAIPRADLPLNSFHALKGKVVTQLRGGHYDPRLMPETAPQYDITLHEMSRGELLPGFVKSGRADVMVGTLLGLSYTIRDQGFKPDDFGMPLQLNVQPSILYLSRKARPDPAAQEILVSKLDRAMSELVSTGWIEMVFLRYAEPTIPEQ